MVAEDFKTWLRVGVVRRLVLKVLDSNLSEELFHDAKQVRESDSSIDHDTFHLVELGQMRCIERLITEDTVDREVLHWLELFLLGLKIQHLGADCRRMRPQDVLHCFFGAPSRTIPNRALKPFLVSLTYALFVLFWDTSTRDWIFTEECVLQVTCWMTLWLEQSVKVPERALNPPIRRHLIEAHREKDFAELSAHF